MPEQQKKSGDAMSETAPSSPAPCSECGCEERDHRGILTCRCPARLSSSPALVAASAYFDKGRCSGHAQFNGRYCREVAGPDQWCIHCAGFKLLAALTSETARREQADAECRRLTGERDAWKDAIIDAAVVDWVYTKEHDTNPRKAINDLLSWQVQIALDPAVSEDAARLVQRAETAEADRDRLVSALREHIEHLHTMNRVAGQASVETLDATMAAADARFADYCAQWAGKLEALLPRAEDGQET